MNWIGKGGRGGAQNKYLFSLSAPCGPPPHTPTHPYGAPAQALEFYLSNGASSSGQYKEDRAPASTVTGASGLYCLPRAGSFKLIRGQVKPFTRGAEARFMLVGARAGAG